MNKMINFWRRHRSTTPLMLSETLSARDVQNKTNITQLQGVYDYYFVKGWTEGRRVWQINDRRRCSKLKDVNL